MLLHRRRVKTPVGGTSRSAPGGLTAMSDTGLSVDGRGDGAMTVVPNAARSGVMSSRAGKPPFVMLANDQGDGVGTRLWRSIRARASMSC
jgi:hypothetical protein